MKLFLTLVTFLVVTLIVTRAVPVDKDEEDNENDDDTVEDEEEDEEQEDEEKGPPAQKSPTSFYHNETEKSYEVMTQGPCPNNLMFVKASKNPDEKYGDCACHQLALEGHPSYVPLVYHHPTAQCYHVYTQGYCREVTQWLVFTSADRVECVENPCLKTANHVEADDEKFVYLNGKCVRIGDSCSATNENFVVAFRNLDVVPSCGESLSFSFQLTGAHENIGCPRGQRPLANGQCLTVFTL